MKLPPKKLTIPLQGHPKLRDDQILGFAKKRQNGQPSLTYQIGENPDVSLLDKAFDILFEETLRQIAI